MATESYKIANNLDESSITRIRHLEKELGACILALEPHNTVKQLCEEDLEKVQKLEKELHVVLLAYRPEVCSMH
ncbi:hypothetical protein Pcar_1493 [Syntrophotalea carbinolica DSM 2380]|uniref:Uncharacterized protein n=1 Tax=Syntrophotalea carbinolica (strain DSM 2380 / NBRC 103641 / GraBd1) TaxID=338963 RepID=Q3A4G8_SYNC1|nr:hypothetical protein [Syntrophotalea carbinolica]ABA88739.1 hypothetical protein Pcar_1493 [Syntrophotalea carbinolica DSM 2380]